MVDRAARAPYEGARVEELEEPLLPRWFVLFGLAMIPVAIGVGLFALFSFGPRELPVEARRPPPADGLTTAVGDLTVGDLEAQQVAPRCPVVEGIQVAGTTGDRDRISIAIDALCGITLPGDIGRRLQAFGQMGGTVRFAAFEATGVDSTLDLRGELPTVLVNARLAQGGTDALWIAPLLVHDLTYLDQPVGAAAAALEAREGEAEICSRLFIDTRPSRACDDAGLLLALPDPLAALREVGFS